MGSWGVRAHESDCGLDLLAVAEDRILRGVKFKEFHVRHITELLRSHIVDSFTKESHGWESQYIDFFYDCTFPNNFAHAVILVAECFAEYRQKGKYQIRDYKADKNRRIAEFIYNNEDLEFLLTELQSILDPAHALYDSWEESESFEKWQLHIKTLCDTISQAIYVSKVYVRMVDGEIANTAKIIRLRDGKYFIDVNAPDNPSLARIYHNPFDSEAKAQEWLNKSEIWEASEGGDINA